MLKFGTKKRSRDGNRKEYGRRVDINDIGFNMDDDDFELQNLVEGMNRNTTQRV